ncbi:MAG: hypothetical protein MK081_14655 [Flavobacteriales bacterium]|nr:hypothetical protein [Flavobacteriales bacterium]
MQGKRSLFVFLLATLFSLFLITPLVTQAQDGILDIHGAVKDTDTNKKMSAVTVSIKQNGSAFDSYTTAGNGKFEFELPLGHSYLIEFASADYVTKKIEINTKGIPPEDMAGGFQLALDMSLFAYQEGFDTSITDQPIGKASFDPVRNSVEFDFGYTERMMKKIEDEFERLEKMAGEMERLLKEFNDLITKGDQKMGQEKFADAVGAYEKALEIFPDKEPAPEKLAAAQAALDAQQADAEKEAEYQRLLSQAKNDIKKSRWEDARDALNGALEIKPDEREPRDLLDEIAKELEALAMRDQFDGIVALADKEFGKENWEAAIAKYEEALALIGTEKYPREQITKARAELDKLNAAAMAAEELEQQYQDAMTLGERNMSNEDYETALRNFQQASNLKPDEQAPKDKISDIEKILADLAAQAEADAAANAANAEAEALEAEYKALIQKADDAFSADDLEGALADYKAANNLKPQDQYPKRKIATINDLLAERDALANADAEEEERRRREEERLAAEEAERLDREARDAEKEAERQRRLEEEEAERERLAREKAEREEEERRRSEEFANNASSSTEDEAERYYNEARKSEERAKTKSIEARKEEIALFHNTAAADAEDRRNDNLEGAREKDDVLEKIYRDGDMDRNQRIADSERKKQRASEDLVVYNGDADMRRDMYSDRVDKKEEMMAAVSSNDTYRMNRIDEQDRKADRYDKNNEQFISKGNASRADNEYNVKRSKEQQRDMDRDGEGVRQDNINDTEYKKETYKQFDSDVRASADQRLDGYGDKVDDRKDQLRDISAGKEVLIEENEYEIQKEKERNEYLQNDRAEEARNRRYDDRKERFEKESGKEKSYDDYILPEGTEDLEEGVQERSYEEGNKMVIERTVKRGNKVDTYRKVISKTGIYYFKNGRSITETTWKRETLDATD